MKPMSVIELTLSDGQKIVAVNFRKHTNLVNGKHSVCSTDLDAFVAHASLLGIKVESQKLLDVKDYVL